MAFLIHRQRRFYNPSGASSAGGLCLPCPPGTFSTSSAQTACSVCPAGKYTNDRFSQFNSVGDSRYFAGGETSCFACADLAHVASGADITWPQTRNVGNAGEYVVRYNEACAWYA